MGRTPPGVRGLKLALRLYYLKVARRTPPGVRGLKPCWNFACFCFSCRTPPGVRGLKPSYTAQISNEGRSHPAWGTWIETYATRINAGAGCRTPPGVRGLKLNVPNRSMIEVRRTPPGVRGLKLKSRYMIQV